MIKDWVELGNAPVRIIAGKTAGEGKPAMTRPLVPFPLRVEYDGSGDENDAANFVVRAQ